MRVEKKVKKTGPDKSKKPQKNKNHSENRLLSISDIAHTLLEKMVKSFSLFSILLYQSIIENAKAIYWIPNVELNFTVLSKECLQTFPFLWIRF